MIFNPKAYHMSPVGVIVRRRPGVTRWQKWHWAVSGVIAGAGPAAWRVLRQIGEVTDYHAATLPLELHGAEAEAYHHNLQARVPGLYVVMRKAEGAHPFELLLITASPFEARDYMESGEELVEKVAMPPELLALVRQFVEDHGARAAFVKRKRDKQRVDRVQDGIGDPRIGKAGDIYASPALKRRRKP